MPLPAGAAQPFNPASLPTCPATVWGGAACSGPKSAWHCPHQDQGCTPTCSILLQGGSGKEGNLATGPCIQQRTNKTVWIARCIREAMGTQESWDLRSVGRPAWGGAPGGSAAAPRVWWRHRRASGLWYFGGRTRGSGVDGGNKRLWGARRWGALPTVRYPGAQGCQGHAIQGFRGWGVGGTHRGLHHQPQSAGAGS